MQLVAKVALRHRKHDPASSFIATTHFNIPCNVAHMVLFFGIHTLRRTPHCIPQERRNYAHNLTIASSRSLTPSFVVLPDAANTFSPPDLSYLPLSRPSTSLSSPTYVWNVRKTFSSKSASGPCGHSAASARRTSYIGADRDRIPTFADR